MTSFGDITLDRLAHNTIDITTTGARQEVKHELGYVPKFFHTMRIDGHGTLTAVEVDKWTAHSLFLKSDVPNLKVRLFVM